MFVVHLRNSRCLFLAWMTAYVPLATACFSSCLLLSLLLIEDKINKGGLECYLEDPCFDSTPNAEDLVLHIEIVFCRFFVLVLSTWLKDTLDLLQ